MPQCPDADLAATTALVAQDPAGAIAAIDALIGRHDDDARLHFLRGSLLIGEKRLIEAHAALRRAVDLAPDFHLARFQLGFFELTSGEAEAAVQSWAPLERLPKTHYLRLFAQGLTLLARDAFGEAVEMLRAGIAANDENPPLSRDMELVIGQCETLVLETSTPDDAPVSETALLLSQFARRRGTDEPQ